MIRYDHSFTTMRSILVSTLVRSTVRPLSRPGGSSGSFWICRRLSTDGTSSSSSPPPPQVILEHHTHENHPNAIVSVLTLNRPKANAMGSIFLAELQERLDVLEEDSTSRRRGGGGPSSRCLIVTSFSPKVFSAGADLKERATMTIEQAEAFVAELRCTMDRFSRLPIPTIAAIEGVALGGGFELALAADIRIASTTAVLGLPETSLAIIPGAGGTQRLPRLVGMARAKELIFTGERINGQTAYDYGLVQHVMEPGQTLSKALDMAWKIAQNGPVAIQAAKYAIQQGMESLSMTEALAMEREGYAKVLTTQDRLEGLASFQQGRTPNYTGT